MTGLRAVFRRLPVWLPVWLGVLAAGLAWLAYVWRESPMAVVVDLVAVGGAAAGLGLGLGGAGLLLVRRSPAPVARGVGVAVVVASAVALASWGWFRASYGAEEVRFSNGEVGLAGTLFTPRGAGPWPAAVMIHGSGRETRRGGAFLARYLARRGVAGLAYDKRGTGESGGALYESDYGDYAADAVAAVERLRATPRIDPERVGLVGVSEGEWVAPQAAAGAEGVAFVVVVGGSGLSPAEQVTEEILLRLEAAGYEEVDLAAARALSQRLLEYQRSGDGGPELAASLDRARSERWYHDAEDFPDSVYPIEEYGWWRGVMDTDPAELWRRVGAPVLLLKGEEDDRSRPGPMEARIRAALAAGGNDDLTVRLFPGSDHALLRWPRGAGTPPPAFARGYPRIVADWIRGETAGPEPGGPEPGDRGGDGPGG